MIEKEIAELQEVITQHDILYGKNQPIITDGEYDKLYFRLLQLEAEYPEFVTENSPTQKVVESIVAELKKVSHSTPMLSQQKTKDISGLLKWYKQADTADKQHGLVAQVKLDGLTLVLTYNEGRLRSAVTRGDKDTGEDVLHNALCIRNIPKKISYLGSLEVRGEVLIPYEEFEKANADGKYSNPRNLASGTVRQLDSSICSQRHLIFVAFDLVTRNLHEDITTEKTALNFLTGLGFTVVKSVFKDSLEINDAKTTFTDLVDYFIKIRKDLPYMIDGIIFKFDDLTFQDRLGFTSKFPRFQIAFKFESQDAITTLRSVDWQLGKSGHLTPVANFDEVDIDSVKITRATLHNFLNISKKDIRINDKILIARSNDVIPIVVMSYPTLRNGSEIEVSIPTHCPHCHGLLVAASGIHGDSDSLLTCINLDCTEQILMKVIHFASRDGMNIDTLGEKIITELFEKNIIQSHTDLYTQFSDKRALIESWPKFGKKKVDNILSSLQESKNRTFSQFLYALAIKNIGKSTSRDIAKEFGSLTNLLDSHKNANDFTERLIAIEGISTTVVDSLNAYLDDDGHLNVLDFYLNKLRFPLIEPVVETISNDLLGLTFVITGKLSMPRENFAKDITLRGGKVSGSVSAKTSYLLLGDGEENSSKFKKATTLNIPILSETDYNALKQ